MRYVSSLSNLTISPCWYCSMLQDSALAQGDGTVKHKSQAILEVDIWANTCTKATTGLPHFLPYKFIASLLPLVSKATTICSEAMPTCNSIISSHMQLFTKIHKFELYEITCICYTSNRWLNTIFMSWLDSKARQLYQFRFHGVHHTLDKISC